MKYNRHIFICTNQRPEGAVKPSCGNEHGLALVAEFKKQLKEKGLAIEIRTQSTGCLDACELGPSLVVYPDGVFYGNVQINDVEAIVQSHLVDNQILTRLQIK
jgi:(2Fe-2S) ferredoxin